MTKKNISEKVSEMALPIIDSKGFELVDVEYIKEGQNWYLRIYIDKEGGITIDDCQIVSEEISEKIDQVDPIPNSYLLEVSSPGLERPLKKDRDFEKYKGELVEVRLYNPLDKKTSFEGELVGLEDGKIIIKIDDKNFSFIRNNVSLVKRSFKF